MADFSGMIKAIKDWAIGKFITEIPIGSDTAVGAVKADGSTTTIDKDGTIHATGGSGSGTSDYNSLSNRPSIGGVTLSGDKTLSELGIQPEGTYLTEETDPTVPSWAKSPTKPTYSKSEVGLGNVPNVTTDDQTPGFTEATERANIASGEKLSVIFGKVMKWFSDLKPHAFVAPITNLLATVSGNALDATMGKELDDKIAANADAIADVNSSLTRKNITSSLGTFACDGATVTTYAAHKFCNIIQMQLKIVPTSDWANDAILTITGINYPSVTTISSQGLLLFTTMYSGGSIAVRNTSGTTITSGTERYIDILYMTSINE